MKDQREAFESWLSEFKSNAILRRYGDGYISATTENYFNCWQAALASQAQQHELARNQPCGCVLCTCEHETQCQGCGAKHCGTHAVGDFPDGGEMIDQEIKPFFYISTDEFEWRSKFGELNGIRSVDCLTHQQHNIKDFAVPLYAQS